MTGSSRVFIQPLLLAAPMLSVGHTLASSDGSAFVPFAEVADGVTGTDLNVLTVIYATSSAASMPAATSLSVIDSNWVGVQVADTTPKVVVHAKAIAASGDNYLAQRRTSATFTTTHSGTGNYLVRVALR